MRNLGGAVLTPAKLRQFFRTQRFSPVSGLIPEKKGLLDLGAQRGKWRITGKTLAVNIYSRLEPHDWWH